MTRMRDLVEGLIVRLEQDGPHDHHPQKGRPTGDLFDFVCKWGRKGGCERIAGVAGDEVSAPTMLCPAQKRCALVHACMGKGQRCMNACTKPSRVPESSWTYLDGRGRPVDMSTAPRDSAHLATPLAQEVEMEKRARRRHGAAPGSPLHTPVY